jgi:hypothetical protein
MRTQIVAGALLLGLGVGLFVLQRPTQAVPDRERKPVDLAGVERLVFFAVLEGLYTDGVTNEDVDIILGVDAKTKRPNMEKNFVYTCPLCHPAYDACVLYRGRQPFYGKKSGGDTFGAALPSAIAKKLSSSKDEERHQAIQGLIDTWVRRRLDDMRLTKDEREEWTQKIAEGRDKGMAALKARAAADAKSSCPICEGAFGACKKQQ